MSYSKLQVNSINFLAFSRGQSSFPEGKRFSIKIGAITNNFNLF